LHAICKDDLMIRRVSKRVKRFWAQLALLSVEMTIVLVLFVVALTAFVYITRRVFVLNKTRLDNAVFNYLKDHVSERNNDIMEFFTFLGTHQFLIPANLSLIAYFLFIKKHKWHSIKIPAIALSSLGLMFLLKGLFDRERPSVPLLFEAKGLSFPSGHALMSVTFYGLLIYMIFKGVKNPALKWTLISLLVILIMIIGSSRVYLRVHYATDVIAGYCIGFLWLVFTVWMLNKIEKHSKRKFDKVVEKPALSAA
jgi:membrane-associated phospholipid phosphatase